MMARCQRLAFTGSGVLAVVTLAGAALGADGILLALPGLLALMAALIGGLLWVWATMISFDVPGEDEEPNNGHGGPKVPEGPIAPPGSGWDRFDGDWDRFDAERREWARDHEPTPV